MRLRRSSHNAAAQQGPCLEEGLEGGGVSKSCRGFASRRAPCARRQILRWPLDVLEADAMVPRRSDASDTVHVDEDQHNAVCAGCCVPNRGAITLHLGRFRTAPIITLFKVALSCLPPSPLISPCWPTLDLPAGNTMLQYSLRPICA